MASLLIFICFRIIASELTVKKPKAAKQSLKRLALLVIEMLFQDAGGKRDIRALICRFAHQHLESLSFDG